MASKASRVTDRCSIEGMASERRMISRSLRAFVRCSADWRMSAERRIRVDVDVIYDV